MTRVESGWANQLLYPPAQASLGATPAGLQVEDAPGWRTQRQKTVVVCVGAAGPDIYRLVPKAELLGPSCDPDSFHKGSRGGGPCWVSKIRAAKETSDTGHFSDGKWGAWDGTKLQADRFRRWFDPRGKRACEDASCLCNRTSSQ